MKRPKPETLPPKKHPERNALIVDWDYFFPIDPNWDWAHGESPFLINGVWPIRGTDFIMKDEPLPEVLPEWDGFWERFRYSLDAPFYVADSNASAYAALHMTFGQELPRVGVWLFDQHHDTGYRGPQSVGHVYENGGVTCEDWMVPVGLSQRPRGSKLHVVYPDHRQHAFEDEPEPALPVDRRFWSDLDEGDLPERFDMVFLCRSGAWVPPWEDKKFYRFVRQWPLDEAITLDDITPRRWLKKDLDAQVRAWRKMLKKVEA